MSPEDQIIRPWLRGDEGYRLTNLHSGHLTAQGQLSKPGFAVQLDWRQDALILLTESTTPVVVMCGAMGSMGAVLLLGCVVYFCVTRWLLTKRLNLA